MTEQVNIALICSYGLGDTFIQMTIANNLALNNYKVTFYSDVAHQIKQHVSNYNISLFPPHDEFHKLTKQHHVILYDSSSAYIKKLPPTKIKWLQHNAIAFHMSSGKPTHRTVTVNQIAQRLPKPLQHHAPLFYKFNDAIGHKPLFKQRPPLVTQITIFLRQKIGLQQVSSDNGLQLKRQAINRKKIIIHPSSSNSNKNWLSSNYLELAKRLQSDGFEPVFTVSPNEREDWLKLSNHNIDVPLFNNIEQLAQFYQDAFCFIGTDSGNAHLASNIGIPTLQIFKRWRSSPSWRAGWSRGHVIIAKLPYCLSKKHWQHGLSVDAIHQQFKHFIAT